MGPCELMDLIGHDTNFAVTQSVFDANFGDKRYTPSLVQREMVDGGLLGRKSGRGFFAYGAAPRRRAPRGGAFEPPPVPAGAIVALHGRGVAVDRWAARLEEAGVALRGRPGEPLERPADRRRRAPPRPTAAPATQVAAEDGVRDLAVFDLAIAPRRRRAGTRARARRLGRAPRRLARAGRRSGCASPAGTPQPIGDAPGLVVARTVAMLINEGADAVQQGVCTPEGADLAMKLGVNHPAGPFEFLARWDAPARRRAARPARRALPRRALPRQPGAARARLARAARPGRAA